MGYQLETTALISKWNYNVFRIRGIMLILEVLHKIKRLLFFYKLHIHLNNPYEHCNFDIGSQNYLL